jgi:hypothetical protein
MIAVEKVLAYVAHKARFRDRTQRTIGAKPGRSLDHNSELTSRFENRMVM